MCDPAAVLFVKFIAMTASSNVPALAGELALTAVRLSRHLRGRRTEQRLSLPEVSALTTLAREGAMTLGRLAGRERVQPPSMTRVVGSLTAMELVARRPHPTDGRQSIVDITEAGRAAVAEESDARETWLTERLCEFSTEDITVLTRAVAILGRINANTLNPAG